LSVLQSMGTVTLPSSEAKFEKQHKAVFEVRSASQSRCRYDELYLSQSKLN